MVSLRPRLSELDFPMAFDHCKSDFQDALARLCRLLQEQGRGVLYEVTSGTSFFRLNILRPKTLWRLDFKRFCSKATASQLCELKWGLQSGPTSVWIQDSELELWWTLENANLSMPQGCSAMWHRLWRPIEQSQRKLPKQPLAEESGSMPSVRFQCLFPSKEFSTCSTSTLRMRSQSNDTSARASSCILLEKGLSCSSVVLMQLAGFCFLSCCHRDSRVEQALMI